MSGRGTYSARLYSRREEVLERVLGPDRRARRERNKRRIGASIAAIALLGGLVTVSSSGGASVNAAPAGQGFTVSAADLQFILKQIEVSEHHAAQDLSVDPCAGLRPDPLYVPGPLVPYGLRTVDGSCNNLQTGRDKFGQSDQKFPRLTSTDLKPAEFGTSYAQITGTVVDSQPRTVSNLIVDQTIKNPSALDAARFPIRSQDPNGLDVTPCTGDPQPSDPDGTPNGCTPSWETLFIPNVTTDVGLSPPYNSLFTIFGQFFDHGLDKINNGGNGVVITPLKNDDPFMAGADRIFGTLDDLAPGSQIVAPLTRGSHNGDHQTTNSDSPFVDLSQAYTSHSAHQVFLREYEMVAGVPVTTGKLLGIVGGPTDGAMANWALVKSEAAAKLGLQLVDTDVNDIPLVLADPYGNYIPGPNGLPRFVAVSDPGGVPIVGGIEGNLGGPVPFDLPGVYKAVRISTAFLNDIAHSAGPGSIASPKTPDFVAAVAEGPGPDGILLDNPLTIEADESADNIPAVPEGPGPDGVLGNNPLTNDPAGNEAADNLLIDGGLDGPGVDCNTVNATAECSDDTYDPGLDLILVDDPLTTNPDEGADDTAPVAAGPGPNLIFADNPLTIDPLGNEAADNTPAVPAHDDNVAGGSLDPVAPGQYDDELLDLHVIAGDGRANENIGLTAIHNVFEREHNRLVADIKATLDANPALKLAYQTGGWGYGSRLFQAARFVTEMEYQHLVFEEFGRKIQPLINPFTVYHDNVNSAITAEFAHAVYRFGHSMLNDTIPRINEDGSHNDIELFDGFLNPQQYSNSGTATVLNGGQAPGPSSWASAIRSATSSTSSSPRRCAAVWSVSRSTWRR